VAALASAMAKGSAGGVTALMTPIISQFRRCRHVAAAGTPVTERVICLLLASQNSK
jgi:hypothetical protein